MRSLAERAWGNEYRTTVVCIDSYSGGVPKGRFYNPYLLDGIAFTSTIDFLLKMEESLDQMNFPQSFCAARTFSATPQVYSGTPALEQEGKVGTFAVRVLFRQNASWQGSVTWLEGKREDSFRSVLELLFLMNSALREM